MCHPALRVCGPRRNTLVAHPVYSLLNPRIRLRQSPCGCRSRLWLEGRASYSRRVMVISRIDVEPIYARHPYARVVLDRLAAAGHDAFLIGGVVRDAVVARLEGHPSAPREVDIATSAQTATVLALFKERPIVRVGERFGVLRIVPETGAPVEVATFRTEGDYDGRRPQRVAATDELAQDVRRRDLTVNGLAARADGELIDLVGGIKDLRARCIRAIGDPAVRFAEDRLRMLRAVRFACQLGGTIHPDTADAIRDEAGGLALISRERISAELFRLLETPRSAEGVELLNDLGLLEVVLPEVAALQGVPQPEEYHPEGDVYVHTVAAVRVADRFVSDPLVKLAVLLHDIGKPQALLRSGGANMGGHCAMGARRAAAVARRLRLSREQTHRLGFLIKNHMRIADFPRMGRGKQVRFMSEGEVPDGADLAARFPQFAALLQLLVADCEASAHKASGWAPVLHEALRVVEHMDEVGSLAKARSLIDGDVLIGMGVEPGPGLGRILRSLHDRILSGEIATAEAAREAARRMIDASRERT